MNFVNNTCFSDSSSSYLKKSNFLSTNLSTLTAFNIASPVKSISFNHVSGDNIQLITKGKPIRVTVKYLSPNELWYEYKKYNIYGVADSEEDLKKQFSEDIIVLWQLYASINDHNLDLSAKQLKDQLLNDWKEVGK